MILDYQKALMMQRQKKKLSQLGIMMMLMVLYLNRDGVQCKLPTTPSEWLQLYEPHKLLAV
jgi:hypothetical protein